MPKISDVIGAMNAKQMLPAIFFIFSRVACDENASKLSTVHGICLTSPEEQLLIKVQVDRLRSGFELLTPCPGLSSNNGYLS